MRQGNTSAMATGGRRGRRGRYAPPAGAGSSRTMRRTPASSRAVSSSNRAVNTSFVAECSTATASCSDPIESCPSMARRNTISSVESSQRNIAPACVYTSRTPSSHDGATSVRQSTTSSRTTAGSPDGKRSIRGRALAPPGASGLDTRSRKRWKNRRRSKAPALTASTASEPAPSGRRDATGWPRQRRTTNRRTPRGRRAASPSGRWRYAPGSSSGTPAR
jgi:hypothetical protein